MTSYTETECWSLSATAAKLGVPRSTLRSWLKSIPFGAQRGKNGHWIIDRRINRQLREINKMWKQGLAMFTIQHRFLSRQARSNKQKPIKIEDVFRDSPHLGDIKHEPKTVLEQAEVLSREWAA